MEIYGRYRLPKVAGLKCPEHSLTEQVYKDQCDLNFLIRKYHLEDDPFELQMMIDPASRSAQFLDATSVPDIYTALAQHQRVKQIFESLDYDLQKRFDFSVDAFANYCLTAPVKDVDALGIPNLRFSAPSTPVEPVTQTETHETKETSSK